MERTCTRCKVKSPALMLDGSRPRRKLEAGDLIVCHNCGMVVVLEVLGERELTEADFPTFKEKEKGDLKAALIVRARVFMKQ